MGLLCAVLVPAGSRNFSWFYSERGIVLNVIAGIVQTNAEREINAGTGFSRVRNSERGGGSQPIANRKPQRRAETLVTHQHTRRIRAPTGMTAGQSYLLGADPGRHGARPGQIQEN